ncbi:structural maintenance of chromosomes protein 5 [Iris pallida]|uniref:Structural maintenance of chromosomes protein 5 n=1 Tax=Iris pallida TaxID=29817 RepID=A0AAX6HTB3_IRIPA|nr:structural maintenance of chromosomes protein 5 [Iris pallida]
MENNNNKLLQALRNSGADKIFEAFKWLQAHRSECRKDVYGPVLLEVNVQNRVHAAYLESHVPNYIWKSFITQDPADRDFLVRNLKAFDIPILNFVEQRGRNKEPFQISREMRELGIYSRLDQVFDAPDAVKEVLITQANLENSYIGSRESDEKADDVNKLGIMDIWTPESHYRWNKSRYDGHISGIVEPVHPSRLFMCSLDVSDVENLRSKKIELEHTIAELEESQKMLQTEQRQLEDEAAKLQREREIIHNKNNSEKKKRREMENRVDQRRRKLESLSQEDDVISVTKKLIDQAAKLNEQRFKLAIKQKNLLVEAIAFKWSFAEKHMLSIELDTKIREMEGDLKQHEKVALQAATHLENCKRKTEQCKQQLSAAKRHAESIAIITEDLTKEFLEMPGTIEELEAAIQDNISEANSILFVNQNILQEYENRQRKIDDMASKVEADDKELQRCLSEITNLKGSWLPTLCNLVVKINETFSRNFQEMAVAGEVSLDEHEMDFDKYGVLKSEIQGSRTIAGAECSSPVWRRTVSFNYPLSCFSPRSDQLPIPCG